jgi:hypothetical protein
MENSPSVPAWQPSVDQLLAHIPVAEYQAVADYISDRQEPARRAAASQAVDHLRSLGFRISLADLLDEAAPAPQAAPSASAAAEEEADTGGRRRRMTRVEKAAFEAKAAALAESLPALPGWQAPRRAAEIAEMAGEDKPVVLAALKQLAAAGRVRITGEKAGTRYERV